VAVCLSMGCVGDVEAGEVRDNKFVSENCVGGVQVVWYGSSRSLRVRGA